MVPQSAEVRAMLRRGRTEGQGGGFSITRIVRGPPSETYGYVAVPVVFVLIPSVPLRGGGGVGGGVSIRAGTTHLLLQYVLIIY